MLGGIPFITARVVFQVIGPVPQVHREEVGDLPVDGNIAVQGQIRAVSDPEAADVPAQTEAKEVKRKKNRLTNPKTVLICRELFIGRSPFLFLI
jgi:hypothetical protein